MFDQGFETYDIGFVERLLYLIKCWIERKIVVFLSLKENGQSIVHTSAR